MKKLNFNFLTLLQFNERPFKTAFVISKVWDDLDKYDTYEGLKKYLKRYKVKLLEGDVTVSGEYDYEKERIIITIYDQFQNLNWDQFKFALIQTICHEFIHWSQYSMRNGEGLCHDGYHDHPDEIYAYGHCIVLERMFPEYVEKSSWDEIRSSINSKTIIQYEKMISRWERKYANV